MLLPKMHRRQSDGVAHGPAMGRRGRVRYRDISEPLIHLDATCPFVSIAHPVILVCNILAGQNQAASRIARARGKSDAAAGRMICVNQNMLVHVMFGGGHPDFNILRPFHACHAAGDAGSAGCCQRRYRGRGS